MIWKPLIYLKKKIYEHHSTLSNGWNLFYPRNHTLYPYWILQTANAKIFTSPQYSYSLERCSGNSFRLGDFFSKYQGNFIDGYYCNASSLFIGSRKHVVSCKSIGGISVAFVVTLNHSICSDILGLCKFTLVFQNIHFG